MDLVRVLVAWDQFIYDGDNRDPPEERSRGDPVPGAVTNGLF